MTQPVSNDWNELEAAISKKIHSFDVISLLRILEHIGYSQSEILFKSHYSSSSQPGLIHSIVFHTVPVRRATVTFNLGLLGAQSPLPSYFQKKLDDGMVDFRAFLDFIGYFDHVIIGGYLLAVYPELDKAVYPDWELAKRQHLMMTDLRSLSSLQWLFQKVFPELGIQAQKAVLSRDLTTSPLVLGKAALGSDAVFGKKSTTPVLGRRVTLFSDTESTAEGLPWAREIRQRLDHLIFPLLRSVGIDLEILLVIRSMESWSRLHSESYLGYDSIRGGKDQRRRVRIFSGRLLESANAA